MVPEAGRSRGGAETAVRDDLVADGRLETPATGLTAAQVDRRIAAGRTNATTARSSRTMGDIVRANVFTIFNGLLTSLFVLVLLTGRWQNGLFMGLVVTNAAIGIVQELRAKRTLDRLAVLNTPRARVVRDGSRTGRARRGRGARTTW